MIRAAIFAGVTVGDPRYTLASTWTTVASNDSARIRALTVGTITHTAIIVLYSMRAIAHTDRGRVEYPIAVGTDMDVRLGLHGSHP
jgi:hypothetical protein